MLLVKKSKPLAAGTGKNMWPFKKEQSNTVVYNEEMKQADSYFGSVLNAVTTLSRRLSGSGSFGISPNGKRNYNELFGYGENLSYADYKSMYERGGYANIIVNLFPKMCWRDIAEIKVDDKNILEYELLTLKKVGFFKAMERADIANRIGRYSVLMLGIPDGLDTKLPVGSAKKGDFKGMYFNVYEEDGIEVAKWDTDPSSPRFNLPELYTLQTSANIDGGLMARVSSMTVHHSRVIHLAEGALSSPLIGCSSLEAVWNAVTDKEKVRGSNGESNFRNSRQKLALETNEGAKPSDDPAVKAALKQNVEDWQNGFEDTLRLNNMKANMLQPQIASPRDSFDISTEDAAGTSRIPVRFLTTKAGGTVTGSEDRASLNGVVQDRQDQECTPWLLGSLSVMSEAGMLELPDNAKVVWPVQASLGEREQSESIKNKADAFKSVVDGLTTVGADDVEAKTVFKAVGLDGVELDDIDIGSSDEDLDKDQGE